MRKGVRMFSQLALDEFCQLLPSRARDCVRGSVV